MIFLILRSCYFPFILIITRCPLQNWLKIYNIVKNAGVFRTTKSRGGYKNSEVDKKLVKKFLIPSTKRVLLRTLKM